MGGLWYRLFDGIGDLLLLNAMFIVGALPVVTLGASLSALYDGVRALGEGGSVVRRFWRSYRASLRLGVATELLIVAALAVIGALCWLSSRWGLLGQPVALLSATSAALVLLALPYWAYLMPHWGGGCLALLRSSIGVAMGNMAVSIVVVLLGLTLLALPVMAWRMFALWFFIGFAVCAWAQCRLLEKPCVRIQ